MSVSQSESGRVESLPIAVSLWETRRQLPPGVETRPKSNDDRDGE